MFKDFFSILLICAFLFFLSDFFLTISLKLLKEKDYLYKNYLISLVFVILLLFQYVVFSNLLFLILSLIIMFLIIKQVYNFSFRYALNVWLLWILLFMTIFLLLSIMTFYIRPFPELF